ncbi:hypothetical protein BH23CHL7_BH23CHL7_05640 [soil metagenome]
MRYPTDLTTTRTMLLVDDSMPGTRLEVAASTAEAIASLRGISDAAADVAECTCPEPCERDHANE